MSKPRGYWHDFENVKHELLAFVDKHGQTGLMPTFQALRDHHCFALLRALPFHGGAQTVARRLGLSMATSAKPPGYWLDFDNVKRELLTFIQQYNLPPEQMPSYTVLANAGRADLLQGMEHHGSIREVCERLGWQLARDAKPRYYWDDFENVQHELFIFIAEHGQPGVMPTRSYFERHGEEDLYRSLPRHGGIQAVAQRLGLQWSSKRDKHWHDFANVSAALQAFIQGHGQPGIMPTSAQLRDFGHTDLLGACQRHGGLLAVAARLDLQRPGAPKPLGYWADFANVEKELRVFMQEHEDLDFLPTRRMLIQAGRHDLAYALYRHGGSAIVAERLGLRLSQLKTARRWKNFSTVKRAISTFMRQRDLEGTMPTQRQLNEAGYGGLSKAILHYGGFPAVARRLGLKSPSHRSKD